MPSNASLRPRRALISLLAALVLPAEALAAFEFSGSKTLFAVTGDGGRTPIGTVEFSPAAAGSYGFKISMKPEAFTDHFLSMREFKCLPGPKEISCHVPYPYPHPATVTRAGLAWLEHSLLFLHKSPAEFGAKLSNGLYYEFSEQGAALVGRPQAIDLNEISAPPRNADEPPFRKALRHEVPAESRGVRELVIE